ncbi:alpha-amylase, partial [Streptococcus pyogenes]
VGYGVYDLFDLGEFDQNGTVITKYGSKQEYLDLITALKEAAIKPIADIVLNHKANGDHKERFFVIKMNPENRQEALTEPYEIEGWTGFDFPGRNGCYNDFKWHWYHFTGLDYDAKNNETGIYMITGDNKGWANNDLIDDEHGNFDYLMYNDLDFKHPEVIQNLQDWAKWFIETTGIEGFRLDAV